jgi:dipeptidyl aminopeptidase/acylaminoacyl peptidase
MIDERERYERAFQQFQMPEPAWDRLIRRRDRKRRNQRITAGVVGIAVFVAAVWIVTSVGSLDRSETPAVPGPAETGPAEPNCVVSRCTETGPAVTAPEPGYLIDLNTGEMTQLPKSIVGGGYAVSSDGTMLPAYSGAFAVSPDGTMVAYASQDDAGNWEVFIASLDGTDVQQVTHDQRGAVDPDWSPDGAAIAYTSGGYTSEDGNVSNIFVLDLATGETSQVTNEKPTTETCCGPVGAAYPQFSPDGASIVYWVNRGVDERLECFPCYGVRIVPVTGGKSVLLVDDAILGTLSPDGSTLAVTCGDRIDRGLCIANADGTNPRVLVSGSAFGPTWSPDGTRIAYINLENESNGRVFGRVFVVDVATGETTFVAEGTWPEWLDDHTLIIETVPR